jgi:hypothetical protein
MARVRAQLLRDDTLAPLDSNWRPVLEPGEVEEANRNLKARGLPFHWQLIPAP